MALLFALLTIIAWGLWLVPSQNVQFANERVRTAYLAIANLAVAVVVYLIRGPELMSTGTLLLSFLGGVFWCISSWAAFGATTRLGLAKAMSLWAPLNVIVACLWGGLLFGEFTGWPVLKLLSLIGAVGITIGGILVIISAKRAATATKAQGAEAGLLMALTAGIIWGSYFIPIRMAEVTLWSAALPFSFGILVTALIGVGGRLSTFNLPRRSDPLRSLLTGALWAVGNYSSLLLMEAIGTGRGFTVAQLCVVVNALAGIFLLQDPPPRSPAARHLIVGVILATIGGILVGLIRN